MLFGPITVKKALEQVPGVTQVTVNFKEKIATVIFAPQKTSEKALIHSHNGCWLSFSGKAIRKIKYDRQKSVDSGPGSKH